MGWAEYGTCRTCGNQLELSEGVSVGRRIWRRVCRVHGRQTANFSSAQGAAEGPLLTYNQRVASIAEEKRQAHAAAAVKPVTVKVKIK